MATITVKTYRCDACGDKVPSQKDLRKFYIQWGERPRYGSQERVGIRVELCKAKCVERFATALLPIIDDAGYRAIMPLPEAEGNEDE